MQASYSSHSSYLSLPWRSRPQLGSSGVRVSLVAPLALGLIFSTACPQEKAEQQQTLITQTDEGIVVESGGAKIVIGKQGISAKDKEGTVQIGKGGILAKGKDGEVKVGAKGVSAKGKNGHVGIGARGVTASDGKGKVEVSKRGVVAKDKNAAVVVGNKGVRVAMNGPGAGSHDAPAPPTAARPRLPAPTPGHTAPSAEPGGTLRLPVFGKAGNLFQRRRGGAAPAPQAAPSTTGARVLRTGNATCLKGQACTLSCPSGRCRQQCITGSSCISSCAGGSCQQFCAKGASCTLSCPGGSCNRRCAAGSSCTKSCAGGRCSG